MKIFVSWSGELSNSIARELKKWIPCIIQSAEVFFSPEDIEKGQNWNARITQELSECNYGIVCLTRENKSTPWINFEAGAIAKALDSRISALMIDINPFDIQGPLSLYQATRLNKDELLKLFNSINNYQEIPIEEEVLTRLFDAVWGKIDYDIKNILNEYSREQKDNVKKDDNKEMLESILQIVREQNRIIGNPKELIPREYLEEVLSQNVRESKEELIQCMEVLLKSISRILSIVNKDENFVISKEFIYNIHRILKVVEMIIEKNHLMEIYDGKNLLYRIHLLQGNIALNE